MKKYIKISIIILIIFGLLYTFDVHIPLLANNIQKQIVKGQSVNQVIEILTSYIIKPDLCCWRIDGAKDPVCSNRRQCDFPMDEIFLKDDGNNFELKILFMGPGFLHNDFNISFNSVGDVVSVSKVRHWD